MRKRTIAGAYGFCGAALLVGSILPWYRFEAPGFGDAPFESGVFATSFDATWTVWTKALMPLVFSVHLPLIAACLVALLVELDVVRWPLSDLSPNRLVQVFTVSAALCALVAVLANPPQNANPAVGVWVTFVAIVGAGSVAFGRVQLLSLSNEHTRPASTFAPRWISLREPLVTATGETLGTDDWYLAIREERGALVIRTNHDVEVALPRGLPVIAAPSP
jgi:hypothetical protein